MYRPSTLKPMQDRKAVTEGLNETENSFVTASAINTQSLARYLKSAGPERSHLVQSMITMHLDAITFGVMLLSVGDERRVNASVQIISKTLEAMTKHSLGLKEMSPPDVRKCVETCAAHFTDEDIAEALSAALARVDRMSRETTA